MIRSSPLLLASIVVAALGGASAGFAQTPDVPALMGQYGCTLCHAEREWVSAPSWAEVAEQYRNQPHAVSRLLTVVRKGKHGDAVWPMPPLPEVPDADAKRIVNYILDLKP